jgi:hypothetical protein
MPGIFISYRRSDTLPWAGRLFDHLTRSFGRRQVFMDINGGITRGADFEQALADALKACTVLLALIGPSWLTCTRQDGRRRLLVDDDWVRNEIATCLARGVPVVPVLFSGAALPEQAALPENLHALVKRQKAEISDTDWHHHVRLLIHDLVKLAQLELVRAPEEEDVETANAGIRLLSRLVLTDRAVADAVARSQEAIRNTYRHVGRLELFKSLHDALHTIEFECLRPLQTTRTHRVRPFKVRFGTEARRIRERLAGGDLDPALRDDLADALAAAESAFEQAVAAPGEVAAARLEGELSAMISSLPARLDQGVADAARNLDLDRLVELMSTVRDTAQTDTPDAPTEAFLQGVQALARLRDELAQRVTEHGLLQRLDNKLRAVCHGGTPRGTLAGEWQRIKLLRARLAGPYSAEFQAVVADLQALEAEIEAALARGDEAPAADLLLEYFRAVGSVFREVDRSLKEFSLRLGAVSQPLKAVLDVC